MTDLVTRLRDVCLFSKTDWQDDVALAREAADEIDRLRALLTPFVLSASHTRVFLTSKERMHADGVALFDEAVNAARAALNAARGEAS